MNKTLCIIALSLVAATVAAAESAPDLRLTPVELQKSDYDETQLGTGGLKGEHVKVLVGDPSKAAFYSVLLFVPPRTTIQAHSHKGDRMATVVSGSWSFGFGERFDPKALKTLPAGSVYSEPSGRYHFAQSGEQPVIVHISGYGPTDTHYFDPKNDPKAKH